MVGKLKSKGIGLTLINLLITNSVRRSNDFVEFEISFLSSSIVDLCSQGLIKFQESVWRFWFGLGLLGFVVAGVRHFFHYVHDEPVAIAKNEMLLHCDHADLPRSRRRANTSLS